MHLRWLSSPSRSQKQACRFRGLPAAPVGPSEMQTGSQPLFTRDHLQGWKAAAAEITAGASQLAGLPPSLPNSAQTPLYREPFLKCPAFLFLHNIMLMAGRETTRRYDPPEVVSGGKKEQSNLNLMTSLALTPNLQETQIEAHVK